MENALSSHIQKRREGKRIEMLQRKNVPPQDIKISSSDQTTNHENHYFKAQDTYLKLESYS
jgi:hypothetical protein